MLFVVHDDDGRINQCSKVYDPTGYGDRLTEAGHKWVSKPDAPALLPPEQWYVPSGVLTQRPIMPVIVSKTAVKAGGSDSAVLTGAPVNSAFGVSVGGVLVWSGTLPDGELELSVPTPGVYRVQFDLWPYQSFAVDIEAIA